MNDFLPEAVRKGLEDARKAALRRSSRLCVHVGDDVFKVLRLWDGGFAMDIDEAPNLRGHVDLYDGARHLSQCLVVASQEENDEMIFEFKWNQLVMDGPAADFVREREAPAGLLTLD